MKKYSDRRQGMIKIWIAFVGATLVSGLCGCVENSKAITNNEDMIGKEDKLYDERPVAEKYAILEDLRLELDRLYNEDRPTYDKFRAALKENTWDALEENWKLWDPVPKKHVVWEGEMTAPAVCFPLILIMLSVQKGDSQCANMTFMGVRILML